MSNTVERHKVEQFSANVYHLLQQEGSRLRGLVRNEIQNGEFHWYDSYDESEVFEKVGRHNDTTYAAVETFRRRNSTRPFFRAEIVDIEDKLKMLHDPESQYAKSFMMAFGRKMDQLIFEAGLNDVFLKSGSDPVGSPKALDDSQKYVVSGSAGGTLGKISLDTLRKIKLKFDANESYEQINLACTSEDIANLLKDNEVISSDYAAVKALVNGEINTFMGINFIRTELVPQLTSTVAYKHNPTDLDDNVATASVDTTDATAPIGSRRCMAWVSSGILLATASDLSARVDELPMKHYSKQVYASMNMGGCRMEEKKVMEIITK
jgi:hypothetical protein